MSTGSERIPPITMALPYPEGSALNLARALAERGELGDVFVTSRKFNRAASGIYRAVGQLLRAERLDKGTRLDLPGAEVHEVAAVVEALRLLGRGTLGRFFGFERMKSIFDNAAARQLDPSASLVFGFPSACLALFGKSEHPLRVFHSVNGPASIHNELLLKYFPRKRVLPELMPDSVVSRVLKEMTLADIILTPSSIVSEQVASLGFGAAVRQVPYGVDLERFSFIPGQRPINRNPKILFVGQVSWRKGVSILLEAAHRTSARIDIAGPVVDRTLLTHLPASVNYLGVLPHSAVPALLNTYDALVLPSVEEAFALIALEAVATGIPVILSDAVGALEMLDAIDVTTVAVGSVDALVEALSHVVVLTPEQREERSRRIHAQPHKYHGWDTYSQAVRNVIIPALRERGAISPDRS